MQDRRYNSAPKALSAAAGVGRGFIEALTCFLNLHPDASHLPPTVVELVVLRSQ
jgi:hypothetical protein